MTRLAVLLACAVLAACERPAAPPASSSTASGSMFRPPPTGSGALYVVAGDIPDTPDISIGSSTAGALAQNSWLRRDLAPGSYTLQARSPYSESSLLVTITADTATFVQLQFVDSRPWRDVLSKVSETEGRRLVSAARRATE
jgi:hypothetical protein